MYRQLVKCTRPLSVTTPQCQGVVAHHDCKSPEQDSTLEAQWGPAGEAERDPAAAACCLEVKATGLKISLPG